MKLYIAFGATRERLTAVRMARGISKTRRTMINHMNEIGAAEF